MQAKTEAIARIIQEYKFLLTFTLRGQCKNKLDNLYG